MINKTMTYIQSAYSSVRVHGGWIRVFFKALSVVKAEGMYGLKTRLVSKENKTSIVEQGNAIEIATIPQMTKFEKMMSGLKLGGIGLEIGPSHSPTIPKREGFKVEILDHATADELINKYRELGIPEERLENIEEVDYIWKGEALDVLTKKKDYYDYIVASHVVEHTPDLVSFLAQCENMLKPGGILSLAVPDKRYCFDVLDH